MSTEEVLTSEVLTSPSAPTAQYVAQEIVRPLLGLAALRAEDDFFELEASSLHLVQIAAKCNQVYGIELPIPDLFDEPTVAGLVRLIERELAEV